MRYLIDGYNLLYALGLARRNGGRAAWDRGRQLLLDWLADRAGAAAAEVTVVFDAQNLVGGVLEETHRGLRVVRARGHSADDLIEDLLRNESAPATLTVVSNDRRVRDAATRAGCVVRKCEEYVDSLLSPARPAEAAPPVEDEKDVRPTREEKDKWLKAFGG